MHTKLNSLSRTTIVLLMAALTSGIMVSSAVSAHPGALLACQVIAGPIIA